MWLWCESLFFHTRPGRRWRTPSANRHTHTHIWCAEFSIVTSYLSPVNNGMTNTIITTTTGSNSSSSSWSTLTKSNVKIWLHSSCIFVLIFFFLHFFEQSPWPGAVGFSFRMVDHRVVVVVVVDDVFLAYFSRKRLSISRWLATLTPNNLLRCVRSSFTSVVADGVVVVIVIFPHFFHTANIHHTSS